jgi:hypothetical protein
MQARVWQAYTQLGQEIPAAVSPVGAAWAEAVRRDRTVDLWARDGRHPSLTGSYLAACVFHAQLVHRDPAGSGYTAGLPTERARMLQHVAADVVREWYGHP